MAIKSYVDDFFFFSIQHSVDKDTISCKNGENPLPPIGIPSKIDKEGLIDIYYSYDVTFKV